MTSHLKMSISNIIRINSSRNWEHKTTVLTTDVCDVENLKLEDKKIFNLFLSYIGMFDTCSECTRRTNKKKCIFFRVDMRRIHSYALATVQGQVSLIVDSLWLILNPPNETWIKCVKNSRIVHTRRINSGYLKRRDLKATNEKKVRNIKMHRA